MMMNYTMTKRTSKKAVATGDSKCTLPARGERTKVAKQPATKNRDTKVFATSKRTRRSPLLLVGLFGILLIHGAVSSSKRAKQTKPTTCQMCQNDTGERTNLKKVRCLENKSYCGNAGLTVCKDCREKSKFFHITNNRKCWLCFLMSAGGPVGSWVTFRQSWVPRLKNILQERKEALKTLERLAVGTPIENGGEGTGRRKWKFTKTDNDVHKVNGEDNHEGLMKWIVDCRDLKNGTLASKITKQSMSDWFGLSPNGQQAGMQEPQGFPPNHDYDNYRWSQRQRAWVPRRRRFLAARSRRRRLMQRVERSKFLAARRRRRRLLLRVRDHSRRN